MILFFIFIVLYYTLFIFLGNKFNFSTQGKGFNYKTAT